MGRHPQPRPQRIRADWVYVGVLEASVLAGVSDDTVNRWIAARKLASAVEVASPGGGRPRKLYRLDRVLALVNDRRG